jgi:hypothetical protein
VPGISLWGNNAKKIKKELQKGFKMKWSNKKRKFYRKNVTKPTLKKIMNFCLKNKINYKTDDGQSYEVIRSELIEASARELRDWGADISRGTPYLDEIDYEQMWDESKGE